MLVATAVGFRSFLVHGKGFGGAEITPQIVPLVAVHGLAMFSWIVLFLVQSVFILNGNRRLHMRVGVGGAVLAAFMVPLGSFTAILSTRHNPEITRAWRGQIFPGNDARRDALLRCSGGRCGYLSSPLRDPSPHDAFGVVNDHLGFPGTLPLYRRVCGHAAFVRTWSRAGTWGPISGSAVGDDGRFQSMVWVGYSAIADSLLHFHRRSDTALCGTRSPKRFRSSPTYCGNQACCAHWSLMSDPAIFSTIIGHRRAKWSTALWFKSFLMELKV